MIKTKKHAFDKDIYLLGSDSEGTNYWLEAASWDCDWYWGFGYVETYTNNKNPEIARDIVSHQHFDGLFFNKNKNGYDAFNEFFSETPLTNNEIWKLCELMKTYYIMREYSDTLHRGGAHYTTNPCRNILQNNDEYNRINKNVMPEIFFEIYSLLEVEQ